MCSLEQVVVVIYSLLVFDCGGGAARRGVAMHLFVFLLIGATTANALSVLGILISAVATMVTARWTRRKMGSLAGTIHELSKYVNSAAIPAQVLLALCRTKGIKVEQLMDWFEEDFGDLPAIVYQRLGRNATVQRFVKTDPSFLRHGYLSHPYFGMVDALQNQKQEAHDGEKSNNWKRRSKDALLDTVHGPTTTRRSSALL